MKNMQLKFYFYLFAIIFQQKWSFHYCPPSMKLFFLQEQSLFFFLPTRSMPKSFVEILIARSRLKICPRYPGGFAWTLGLWLHPRSLVFSLYTWTLWILDSEFAQTSGHVRLSHPCLRLCPRYSGDVNSRIWYPSQIESTRRWLRSWYSGLGACILFSGFTDK